MFLIQQCLILDLWPVKINNRTTYKQIINYFIKNIDNDYVVKNLHFTQFAIDYIEVNEQLKCEQGYSAIYQSYKQDKCLPYCYYSVGATDENKAEKIAFKIVILLVYDLFNLSSFYDDFKKLEDIYAQNRNFLIDELQSAAGQFEDNEVI